MDKSKISIGPTHMSRELLEEAKRLGIETISVDLSGGSDEAFVDVSFDAGSTDDKEIERARSALEESVREVVEDTVCDKYGFSGAGEGTDYGDEYEYHINSGTITKREWSYRRVDEEEEKIEMSVRESESEDEDED